MRRLSHSSGVEAAAQGFKPGDRVAALLEGNCANLVKMPWENVVKIPEFKLPGRCLITYSLHYGICINS